MKYSNVVHNASRIFVTSTFAYVYFLLIRYEVITEITVIQLMVSGLVMIWFENALKLIGKQVAIYLIKYHSGRHQ